MYEWKMLRKYWGMLSYLSGLLGLGRAADSMVWGGERSSVPGASSSSSLVNTRLCKVYNEYKICKMQYAKGGSCRTGWV